MVAGVAINIADCARRMLRCDDCGFQFKHEPIPLERLLECYAAASEDHWGLEVDPIKRRFDLIRSMAESHSPGRRILDVGCFNGAMLDYFGSEWKRYGVEPSLKAREIARSRRIEICGSTPHDLSRDLRFDCITVIDVMEHLDQPLQFIRELQERLTSGGVMILVTGDTASPSWRLVGNAYWYASLPEHVSFYSIRSVKKVAEKLGMQVVDCRTLSHERVPLKKKMSETAKNLVYVTARKVSGLGIGAIQRRVTMRAGPWWLSANDHLFCVVKNS